MNLNMNLGAEVPFDEGGGAAEMMGFDVLEIDGGEWLGLPPGGGGDAAAMNALAVAAAAAGAGAAAGALALPAGMAWGGDVAGAGAGGMMEDSDDDSEDGQALEDVEDAGNNDGGGFDAMEEDEQQQQQQQNANEIEAPWPNNINGDDGDQGGWAEDSDEAWQGEPPGAGAGAGAGADAADVVMPPHGAAVQAHVPAGLQAVGDPGALAAQAVSAPSAQRRRHGTGRGNATNSNTSALTRGRAPQVLMPHLGSLTGGHTTPDLT
ncbi:unnamed protein product, partial [Ectocarpus sp. 12 AP-2014]